MTARIAAAAAALALPFLARADFEGLLVSKMTSGPMNGTARTLVSKAGIRSETEIAVPEGQQAHVGKSVRSITIVKASEPDRTYFLNENAKTYSVFEHEPRGPGDDRYTARKLGKDTVAGFSCEKVALTSASGDESELCVAREFIGGDSWLRLFQARDREKGRASGMWKALSDAGVQGVPIRWSSKGDKGGQGKFQMELVSATRQSVPASSFAIPAGYKKSELLMPFSSPETAKKMEDAMRKLTPEQRKQMEEMMKKYGREQE